MKKMLTFTVIPVITLFLVACGSTDAKQSDDMTSSSQKTENYSWQVVSMAPEDYGIVYDDDTALTGWGDYPLDKLCAYYLGSDGAYAEGSGDELYRRFMDAPNTVLNYLALIGEQTVPISNNGSTASALTLLCRNIAGADVAWYGNTDEFSQIMKQYQKIYTTGKVADVLACLQEEHDASIKRNS